MLKRPTHTIISCRAPLTRALAGVLALAGILTAAGATIQSRVDRDTLTLGDRIQLLVTVTAPRGATVVPPETEAGFGDFRVKEWNTQKTELPAADSVAFRYSLATYTMKACSIPSLPYVIVQGEQADTLATQVIPVLVKSVITGDSVDIKGLKPQQKAGRPSLTWLWIALSALAVLALIVGGLYLRRRLRKPPPPPPPKPPYDEAIEALNRLEALNYVKMGRIREYVFGLSEILKRYIERRYDVTAAEFTTEEMLAWVERSALLKDDKRRAEWFFRNTDPVKFARHIPDDGTLHRFAEEVRGFLDATRPAAMVVEQKPQTTGDKSQATPNPQEKGASHK